jgi:exopolysaccharide biosynthesis polyprenyl glycosylphosphotransferase
MEPRVVTQEQASTAPQTLGDPGGRSARRWLPRLALPGIGLRASERRLLLLVVDLAVVVGALVHAILSGADWLDPPGAFFALWRWWATLAVLWWLMANLLECYDLARAASAPHSIISAAIAAALTVLIYQWIPLITPPLASRKLVLIFGLLAVGGLVLWRGAYAVLLVQPNFYRRALVLGAGSSGQALVAALAQVSPMSSANPLRGTGYQIAGFVDDDPAKQEAGQVAGVPVVGVSADLLRLARELAIDEVVLAITQRHTMSATAFEAVLACREMGFHVTTMPALYERLLGRVPVDHVGRNVQAVLPDDEAGAGERLFWLAKRLADIVLSVLGLAVLALLIPCVALANRISSRGPLIYRQVRVGRGGRSFTVIKFRTMRPDAEQDTGAVWAQAGDARVTPAGRWLRKTRLDELPQVLNVLRGEMSLIGPRPERPEFVDDLARQIPFYRARLSAKPGLTGWAQVRFGYGNSVDDARTKLEYDLYYVRHASFYLDALIVLKTIGVMLRLQGK